MEDVMTTDDQKNAALFMQLVFTFQAAAWQQMGKIKNPLTDKIEKDLNQARFSIDILEMIRTKTKGNLSDDERRFIEKVLSELQLNFVAELDKEQKEKKAEEEEVKEEKPAEAPEEKKEEEKAEEASKPKAKAKPKPKTKPKTEKKDKGSSE
jgi:cell division septation protein DedD